MKLFIRHPTRLMGLLPALALLLTLWQVPMISLAQRQLGLRAFLQAVVSNTVDFSESKPDPAPEPASAYLQQAGRQLDTTRPLGVIALAEGQLALAERYLQECLRRRPEDDLAHFFLGEVYRRRGETAAAIAHWEQAGATPYLIALAQTLLEQQAQAEALAALEAAIRLEPLNIEARRLAGDAWLKQGHLEQALAWYQQLIAVAPENASGYERVARLLFERGYYREAALFFRQALERSPGPPPGLVVMLGRSYAALGEWPEATRAYQQALDLDPGQQGHYLLLAEAKCRLGLPAEAATYYEHALQLGPGSNQAQQAARYIRQHSACPSAE